MSDGALSQAEIDALLAGVDSAGGGSSAPAATANFSETERKALEGFLAATTDSLSSSLSMMTGATVSLKGPQLSISGRDNFLKHLPDTVTAVKIDFSSGFPGEHIFIMSEDCAKSIASLMNKEDNIQLDEMALSMIGEAVGTIVGAQITALTGKTGNKSIANIPPTAANVPKATAALPGGDFAGAQYQLDLGDGSTHQFWEVFGAAAASDIAKSLSGGGQSAPAPSGGMAMNAMPNMGGANMGGMQMGMGSMGGMNMGGGGMFMGPANVQSVQFPNLMQPNGGTIESGNIGLIMDVFMEMTVELGRTKKLIKEILGMGEGTIIELDKLAGEPVDILVNHKLIAKGEVVVIDENFGVRVTEIVSPMERMNDMG
ncbi:MAG: flagellar motor switch protein FliN [Treponema sp.]|nr:flagellar motor switch protein FliN [Treponema sp.]